MADCSTLLDEALESFVFSYLTDSPEPGVEPLSLDFPEIDLSQLDASDFDTNSCFNELQWCNDQSENESSQFSTDDSELFQIDGENEALLAALTQTLDDIQEDDINFSAFISSGDGDIYPAPALSPKPSRPAEFPKSLETEDELSILKKLLLSPAQTPTGFDTHNESSSRHQGTSKVRLQRQCLKVESSTERPAGIAQALDRSCSELHRHLVSTTCVPQPAAKNESNNEEHQTNEEEHSEDESASSSAVFALQGQEPQFTCEKEKQVVVDLIRYMHTYCLPLKKHHSDEKHQQSNSLLKRRKSDSTQSLHTFENKVNLANAKGSCLALGMVKRTRRTRSGSSILKELLARDICEDVSKPYRLAQPVYAAFSHLSCSHLLQDKIEGGLGKGIRPVLEKTVKPYLALRKEGQCIGADCGSPAQNALEPVTNKSASKQECSVYVRRSSRLNPEFWFNEEASPQTCTARRDADSQPPDAQNLCLTLEPFVDEEQVAEIEVDESNQTNGQIELDRALLELDILESDALEAHSDIVNQQYHPLDNTRCSPLTLTETSSAFEKRTFEQGLTVELCGTAGLTPPTTPPYKPAEEDMYKPEISPESVNKGPIMKEPAEEPLSVNRKLSKKQPERTELFAHLSRTESLAANSLSLGIKRPFSRSFGDHDYCQVNKSETLVQRKVLKSLDIPRYSEKKKKQPVPQVPQRKITKGSLTQDSKVLKDHEIRASLTKHFGFPDNTLKEEDDVTCINPEYDSVFEDSDSDCSSADEVCLSPIRTKSCSRRSPQPKLQSYRPSQTSARIISLSDSKRTNSRYESNEQRQTGNLSQRQIQGRRQKAIDEGRLICIRNLSNSINANELKRRFEVFGEITECLVLSRNRGDKYGLITYRCHEDAVLSLKKGTSLRKRNEPAFYMSSGGLRHFFWTKYTDLDSNAVEPSSDGLKSKYESMDFDSLLQEAQRSLHR
ncbi:peroxisome proliferator-activated receptor gamma coactivator 1-beta isoform X1 [Bufo gargarizans]|uniref:peroxisome proliferator-activated receptor gamma coactivator 1-beta isoform X1 n=1 Tax=Bufo gargarizans TaxID=30331 RepID=UPI001CF5A380|nr:peroxisome proliferator-activated receptor gamma coactivator 1-beta isoform X1 [Bufo gargarizans]XP_044136642.1 peroxisome proliferator-activated receptor gamma coactivator 1-beta isoform X1 [Bufo gargarizans]